MYANNYRDRDVATTLSKPDMHEIWDTIYYNNEGDRFSQLFFDYVESILHETREKDVLEVGCGKCVQAIRLAERGFTVRGIDISEVVLEEARALIRKRGFRDRVVVECGNLCDLQIPTGSCANVVCWGVLMHIPDIEQAVCELARVCRPGGFLMISENNMHSLESKTTSLVRRILRRNRPGEFREIRPAGREIWTTNSAGRFLEREANFQWLIQTLKGRGFSARDHRVRTLTDCYARFSSAWVRKIIWALNVFWFQYIRSPRIAYGNILVMQKESAN